MPLQRLRDNVRTAAWREFEAEREGTHACEQPVYHYVLSMWDNTVRAAITIQRAFRTWRRQVSQGERGGQHVSVHTHAGMGVRFVVSDAGCVVAM